MNEQTKNKRPVLISLFIAVEIMLFIALDLGGAGIVFKGAAAVTTLILVAYFWKEISNDLTDGLYITLLPIIFYGFITFIAAGYGSVGDVFDGVTYFDPSKEVFMQYSFLERLFNMIGLVGIVFLGYFLRKTAVFSPRTIFLVLLGGLAVPVLISLLATLANYGFFHTLTHGGLVHFYGGQAYLIAGQASYLVGFKIMTVDLSFLVTSALFLTSVGVGLLFTNHEEEKNERLALILISGIGLFTLILTGSFTSFLYLVPALLFALIIKFDLLRYFHIKRIFQVFAVIFGLGLLIFLLTAYNVFDIQTLWASNYITRRLFMNGILQRYYAIFVNGFSFNNLYGQFSKSTLYNGAILKVFPSGNVFFDALWIDGIIGGLAFGLFALMLIYRVYNYYQKGDDREVYKVVLVSFLLTVFFRYLLKYPFEPYVYTEDAFINFYPLINNPIFLISVFLTGYVFLSKTKKEELVDEK